MKARGRGSVGRVIDTGAIATTPVVSGSVTPQTRRWVRGRPKTRLPEDAAKRFRNARGGPSRPGFAAGPCGPQLAPRHRGRSIMISEHSHWTRTTHCRPLRRCTQMTWHRAGGRNKSARLGDLEGVAAEFDHLQGNSSTRGSAANPPDTNEFQFSMARWSNLWTNCTIWHLLVGVVK